MFKCGIYEDLELLESYSQSNENCLTGYTLAMTDSRNFAHPKSKNFKSWDYDISHGNVIQPNLFLNTPIGGITKSISLKNSYNFEWMQVGNYYFLKLKAIPLT